MGYFIKGQGLRPVAYKSDVKIGSVTIPSAGKYLARDFGLDGASLIDVQLGELPSAITDFIGGNANVTSMIVPPSVSDVKGIFTPVFPNLAKIFLGSAANDSTLKDGLDTAYAGLNVDVYVADTLLAGYQTKYANEQNLTFVAVTSTVPFEIPYVGESTLTADYVRQVAGDLGTLASVFEKVVVPVEFTDYESGSIQAIIDNFSSMATLTTCFEEGNIDLDMNGDIVAKILSLNKTVDEALVYARSLKGPINGRSFCVSDNNVIIAPPIKVNWAGGTSNMYKSCPNLVYIGKVVGFENVTAVGNSTFGYNPKLIEIAELDMKSLVSIDYLFMFRNGSLKRAYLKNLRSSFGQYSLSQESHLEAESLRYIINNLWDNSGGTTQTLTIGATNLAKLTAEDIAIATNKNWQLA